MSELLLHLLLHSPLIAGCLPVLRWVPSLAASILQQQQHPMCVLSFSCWKFVFYQMRLIGKEKWHWAPHRAVGLWPCSDKETSYCCIISGALFYRWVCVLAVSTLVVSPNCIALSFVRIISEIVYCLHRPPPPSLVLISLWLEPPLIRKCQIGKLASQDRKRLLAKHWQSH